MTWCALADTQRHSLARSLTDMPVETEMPSGTLMLEVRIAPQSKPQPLFALELRGAENFELALQSVPGGGVHFLIRHGAEVRHAALTPNSVDQSDRLRISYAWDLKRHLAHLVVEQPGCSDVLRHEFSAPLPLTNGIAAALMRASSRRFVCEDILFIAVSDQVEPVGPMPAMCPRTPIQTPSGPKPAGSLKRGDLVTTLNGDAVPVLHSLRHTVPARGSFQPVRLRAPYFGLTKDIVVTPDARLVVGGTQVEYLFGSENVLVPVKHLTSDVSAHFETGHQLVTYVQLLLPDHEAIIANGTALESLSIGRLRRKKELVNFTFLRDLDPLTIPEHSKTIYPVLKSFEAVTLAQHRAA